MSGLSPWLSAKEAASYIGRNAKFSHRWMVRLASAGKINAGFDGKTYRFKAEDLDNWMIANAKRVTQ